MSWLIEYLADPYVIMATLFLMRPVLLLLTLIVIFNIRENRTQYFPIEKNDVYFVGSVFAGMFILAALLLSLLFGRADFINTLLGSRPAVNYGTILVAYAGLFAATVHVLRRNKLEVRGLMHLRTSASVFYVFPSLLILLFLGARAFSLVFGVGVFGFSDGKADITYLELVTRLISYLVVIPIAEELYFRGVVYNALRNYYRKRSAAILISCYFAVGHLSYFPSVTLWFFLKGLIYIVLYDRYRTLVPGMVLHAVTNVPIAV